MPTFPWPAQPEASTLEALLAGNCRPEEAPNELRPVAEVLAALLAPPDRREVAGWGEALTVYREMAGRAGTPGRPDPRPRRRPGSLASLLRVRLMAAAGAATVAALGGGVAAAYTGSLPAALQKIAHEALAAPDARVVAPTAEGSSHPAGPSVTGAAAYGLCNAYQHAEAHGTASQRAVAFGNLVHAAGGADKVAAYCAPVPHPGPTTGPGRRVGQTGSSANPGRGHKPTAPPGKPTKAPGKPSTPPGKPTASPGNGNGHGNGGGNGNGN